jgi:hypothetical protein
MSESIYMNTGDLIGSSRTFFKRHAAELTYSR